MLLLSGETMVILLSDETMVILLSDETMVILASSGKMSFDKLLFIAFDSALFRFAITRINSVDFVIVAKTVYITSTFCLCFRPSVA